MLETRKQLDKSGRNLKYGLKVDKQAFGEEGAWKECKLPPEDGSHEDVEDSWKAQHISEGTRKLSLTGNEW